MQYMATCSHHLESVQGLLGQCASAYCIIDCMHHRYVIAFSMQGEQ